MDESCFLTDIYLPRMLYAFTIRSPVAKGRLKSIECPEFPAHCTLITAKDIPGQNSLDGSDHPLFADENVSYIGEPVALVVGPDTNILEGYIRDCKVIVEEDTPFFENDSTNEAAIAARQNICVGNPEEAFAAAATVVRGTYTTGIQEHWYAEPSGAVAWLDDPDSGTAKKNTVLTVRTATQSSYHVKRSIARMLGTGSPGIRVKPASTGLHMDGKYWYPSLVSCHAALAALITRKPVALILTRWEDFAFSPKRCEAEITIASALDEKGAVTGIDITTSVNIGAYGVNADEILKQVNLGALGVYRSKNIRLSGIAFRTNIPPQGPFAGFGLAQGFFAMERHVSNIADQCRQDPAAWRKEHCSPKGTLPFGLPVKNAVSVDLLIDAVVKKSDYGRKWASYELLRHSQRYDLPHSEGMRGIGIATGYQGNGLLFPEQNTGYSMELTLEKDGSLEIKTSIADTGSGFSAVWKETAAKILGVDTELIKISCGTEYPDSGSSTMSCNVSLLTRLVEHSCIAIRKQRFRDPLPITVRKTIRPHKNPIWEKYFSPDENGTSALDCNGFIRPSWACAVVEVEIDPVRYIPRIRGVWMYVDGGKIIREDHARNSLKLSVFQALGWMYREQINYVNGSIPADQFENFGIPGSWEIPSINIEFMESGFGKPKGIGDLPFTCVPAAYFQAVSQALDYHFHSIPLQALDIWYAGKMKKNEADTE